MEDGMRFRVTTLSALIALAAPLHGGPEPARPRLDLRVTPRVAFSPANVLVTAELVGGEEHEDFYCPALEWDWGDGARSAHEADCPPFEPGVELDRRFTAEHGYRSAGTYTVKLTMRRASRRLAVATATVNVRPGFRDASFMED